MAETASSLREAATAVENANSTQAADILGDVFSEGGVLDALSDVLASARDLITTRLPVSQWGEHPAGYELYHQLSATAKDLRDQTQGLRDASRVLRELPDTAPTLPAEGRPTTAPAPRRPQGWVPPAAIQETPAALEAITARLDAGTTPASAALLTAPVFDPDGGVLERLSELLASASRYARRHGAEAELWQNLGRASQHLSDIGETLDGTAAGLAKLPATTGSAHGQGKSPGLPAPAASATAGRRR